ncbi:hypothetical protein [Paenibacillus sp. DMB20]|uniref:hypothetical protein n=1 Tax=Paenibacillus sp. DMB20 TaxID=1642570 RepID=UPI0006280F89|nr:hypothetical protein [Paenibacillus sp. DMB20]KKO54390.1 hypothetical protein XI25_07325 [Paenibacillus sp. DMB20]
MKLLKWLLKISLTAVLVSTLTILTTGIVVNAYIQSVLASFNIQLEGQPMGIGGIMKNVFGMNSSKAKDTEKNVTGEKQEGADPFGSSLGTTGTSADDSAADAKDGTAGSSDNGLSSDTGSEADSGSEAGRDGGTSGSVRGQKDGDPSAEGENPPPEDSVPVMGNAGESATQVDQQMVMTPDELMDKKSSLTMKEKEEIFTLLMNKLPQPEMQKISEAMEDGLTAEELEEIERGISKYLSKNEFDKLLNLLQK